MSGYCQQCGQTGGCDCNKAMTTPHSREELLALAERLEDYARFPISKPLDHRDALDAAAALRAKAQGEQSALAQPQVNNG